MSIIHFIMNIYVYKIWYSKINMFTQQIMLTMLKKYYDNVINLRNDPTKKINVVEIKCEITFQ